jgi:hypothetical protein
MRKRKVYKARGRARGTGRSIAAAGRVLRKKPSTKEAPHNYDTLLLNRLVLRQGEPTRRHLQLQELLYAYAPELSELAFKYGFGLGAEAYRISGGGMGALERLMYNSGFGRMVYHVSESRSVLAFSGVDPMGESTRANMHVFQAGVISGYLSAHSRRRIYAREEGCAFNGAKSCVFVARPHGYVEETRPALGFTAVLNAMDSAIGRGMRNASSDSYVLAMGPFFGEPLLSEASRFLYMAGKQLSKGGGALDGRIKAIAGFLGIKSASVNVSKNVASAVTLSYDHATSVRGFVELTAAFVSGFVKGRMGVSPRVQRSVSRTGAYIIRLLLK